jgi:hypothetical protein
VGLSPSQSREPSPQYEDALEGPAASRRGHSVEGGGDVTVAANVPLPTDADTPQKGRSPSPGPVQGAASPSPEGMDFGSENNLSNCRLDLGLLSCPVRWHSILTGGPFSRYPLRGPR